MLAWGTTLLGLFSQGLARLMAALLGPLAFLGPFMPHALVGVSLLGGLGYVYHEGRVHERKAQAKIIAQANAQITAWNNALAISDQNEDARVKAAVDMARESFARSPSAAICEMNAASVTQIQNILGGE